MSKGLFAQINVVTNPKLEIMRTRFGLGWQVIYIAVNIAINIAINRISRI